MAEYIELGEAISKIRTEGVLSICYHGDEEIEKNVIDMLDRATFYVVLF